MRESFYWHWKESRAWVFRVYGNRFSFDSHSNLSITWIWKLLAIYNSWIVYYIKFFQLACESCQYIQYFHNPFSSIWEPDKFSRKYSPVHPNRNWQEIWKRSFASCIHLWIIVCASSNLVKSQISSWKFDLVGFRGSTCLYSGEFDYFEFVLSELKICIFGPFFWECSKNLIVCVFFLWQNNQTFRLKMKISQRR